MQLYVHVQKVVMCAPMSMYGFRELNMKLLVLMNCGLILFYSQN